MTVTKGPFPYDLPIWRDAYEATSPNGRLNAAVNAFEVSMGNPTMGTLIVSNGLTIEACSPAFIWSDDSRYLAIPQFRFVRLLGLQLQQRLLVVDIEARKVMGSKPFGWYLQPQSFSAGRLVVEIEPHRKTPRKCFFQIPDDLGSFILVTEKRRHKRRPA